jgi:acyl carrier protein
MNDLKGTLEKALAEIKGENVKISIMSADMVADLGLDSIEFVDLFFKLERSLKVELEFADLKRYCRQKRKGHELKILAEDVIEYLTSLAR